VGARVCHPARATGTWCPQGGLGTHPPTDSPGLAFLRGGGLNPVAQAAAVCSLLKCVSRIEPAIETDSAPRTEEQIA
jgi:hypothetical protein